MLKINEIYHGDCFDVMKEIQDNSIDMIVTDPPYGTTNCSWDSIIPLDPMWSELKRITKKNSAIVMTATQPFTSILGYSNIKMLKYSLTWIKSPTGQLNVKRMPLKNVEDILIFYQKQPTYNQQFTYAKPYKRIRGSGSECYGKQRMHKTISNGLRYPTQTLNIPNIDRGLHPTQKPVKLFEYLIKTYTNENDLVLDFCAGSGTTGVAAKQTNRNFICIEKEEKYYNIAKKRIEEITNYKGNALSQIIEF